MRKAAHTHLHTHSDLKYAKREMTRKILGENNPKY